MVGAKAFDFYALSCGSFRKQSRNLIETAQRKSQSIRQTCRLQGKSFFKFLFSGETDLEKFEARKRKRVKG